MTASRIPIYVRWCFILVEPSSEQLLLGFLNNYSQRQTQSTMLNQLAIRGGISCALLLTLPWLADELTNYFQMPHIFGGIAAIASCVGASLPLLGMIRSHD
jgi:hypothetical protein